MAFARKCGVAVSELTRLKTDKGEWLTHSANEPGQAATDLLIDIVGNALENLPIPRPMRWGSAETAFVRPVHWVVMLYGSAVVEGELLGVSTGRSSRGHRFMGPAELEIAEPSAYAALLENTGFVIVDVTARRERIRSAVNEAAVTMDGRAVADGHVVRRSHRTRRMAGRAHRAFRSGVP